MNVWLVEITHNGVKSVSSVCLFRRTALNRGRAKAESMSLPYLYQFDRRVRWGSHSSASYIEQDHKMSVEVSPRPLSF